MDLNRIEICNDVSGLDWGIDAIKAPMVWDKTSGEGVKIAVIDTGLDHDRFDFSDSFKFGIDMFKKKFDVEDKQGHGTHVAGLIAGKATGVAFDSQLYIAKVLNDEGLGSAGSVLDGITFAIEHEVDILCMSLGVPSNLPMMMKERIALAYQNGITIVCATGNDGESKPQFPAQLPEVIAVGGLNKDMSIASFSNGGHDVLAPSVDIFSTYKNGNYAKMSGTSMATPLVTGGIALLISYYRNQGIELTPKQIQGLLKQLPDKKLDIDYLINLGLEG